MYAELVIVDQKIHYYFEQAIKADRGLVLSLFYNLWPLLRKEEEIFFVCMWREEAELKLFFLKYENT